MDQYSAGGSAKTHNALAIFEFSSESNKIFTHHSWHIVAQYKRVSRDFFEEHGFVAKANGRPFTTHFNYDLTIPKCSFWPVVYCPYCWPQYLGTYKNKWETGRAISYYCPHLSSLSTSEHIWAHFSTSEHMEHIYSFVQSVHPVCIRNSHILQTWEAFVYLFERI